MWVEHNIPLSQTTLLLYEYWEVLRRTHNLKGFWMASWEGTASTLHEWLTASYCCGSGRPTAFPWVICRLLQVSVRFPLPTWSNAVLLRVWTFNSSSSGLTASWGFVMHRCKHRQAMSCWMWPSDHSPCPISSATALEFQCCFWATPPPIPQFTNFFTCIYSALSTH